MPVPQTILTRKTKYALFLVMTINEGGESGVRDFLAELGSRINSVSSRAPDQALAGIISIGSAAWDRLFEGARPRSLRPFVVYEGPVHTAPATPADLLLHIKADQADLCYELGRLAMNDLGDAITVVDEVHGFRYFDLRDLIGFVDGSENPVGQAAIDAITVGDEDPAFAGGSYVAIQRYLTDFAAWNAIGVTEQENAIGRTKLDNVEMSDDVKPANSHIALNVVEDANGEEIDVVRDNMPYGNVSGTGELGTGEAGTFYIAYSSGPDVTEEMLRKMFIGDPPGNYDRLLDFTTAVTGAQFFTPTVDFLDDLPPAPAAGTEDDESDDAPPTTAEPRPTAPSRPSDGSLGIGSLH
ncbi:Dyp-type peroxidase [Gordonia sp. N1V]|uniref:Dyp-type peroxidase n=1 Tax=Gordonia sp. N1V TaxID=3034163 RepID=UPI0023E11409|nr:Dyp-type peroxidase [Gordonia sp. N1V]MDF3282969.1 Dyp-type peroxidase [Gordonia sp. N1V]